MYAEGMSSVNREYFTKSFRRMALDRRRSSPAICAASRRICRTGGTRERLLVKSRRNDRTGAPSHTRCQASALSRHLPRSPPNFQQLQATAPCQWAAAVDE